MVRSDAATSSKGAQSKMQVLARQDQMIGDIGMILFGSEVEFNNCYLIEVGNMPTHIYPK